MKINIVQIIIILYSLVSMTSGLSNSGGENWAYSKDINIQENSGKSLTDYQVLIGLDPSNFDFSQAKSDGSDIRFTLDGVELPYWIEKWDKGAQSRNPVIK